MYNFFLVQNAFQVNNFYSYLFVGEILLRIFYWKRKTKKKWFDLWGNFKTVECYWSIRAGHMRIETILALDKPVLGERPKGYFHLTGSTGRVAVDKQPRGNMSTNSAFRNGMSTRFVNAHRQQRLVVGFDWFSFYCTNKLFVVDGTIVHVYNVYL